VWIFTIYIAYYYVEEDDTAIHKYNISTDGFCIIHHDNYCFSDKLPTSKFKSDILEKLPTGYEFIDYSYKIKNTSLSYFHRDVTSSQYMCIRGRLSYSIAIYYMQGVKIRAKNARLFNIKCVIKTIFIYYLI
jgi:hypothetical protein